MAAVTPPAPPAHTARSAAHFLLAVNRAQRPAPHRLREPGRRSAAAAVPQAGHVCVVLHDVAPARWGGCTRVLSQLRGVAADAGVDLPVTLLVVPMMHGAAGASQHYLRWLHRQADLGHELALHGLTHRDEGAPPAGWLDRLRRGVYTAGEGEFAALTHAQAAERLGRGLAWARQQQLHMPGFVAPAWLMNEAAWQAVTEAGFTWTATLDRVVTLPARQALKAQSLVFSTRSAWRRGLSLLWNSALGWQQHMRNAPLMRLELHPDDGDHPAIRRCWQGLLQRALQDRQPLRLGEAAARAHATGTPPAEGAS